MRVTTMIGACALVLTTNAFAQAPAGDAARGKALFMKNMCYTCHGTVGQGGESAK